MLSHSPDTHNGGIESNPKQPLTNIGLANKLESFVISVMDFLSLWVNVSSIRHNSISTVCHNDSQYLIWCIS